MSYLEQWDNMLLFVRTAQYYLTQHNLPSKIYPNLVSGSLPMHQPMLTVSFSETQTKTYMGAISWQYSNNFFQRKYSAEPGYALPLQTEEIQI